MKLTYWCCQCIGDDEVYNIRAKSKKEAFRLRGIRGEEYYGLPIKQISTYWIYVWGSVEVTRTLVMA